MSLVAAAVGCLGHFGKLHTNLSIAQRVVYSPDATELQGTQTFLARLGHRQRPISTNANHIDIPFAKLLLFSVVSETAICLVKHETGLPLLHAWNIRSSFRCEFYHYCDRRRELDFLGRLPTHASISGSSLQPRPWQYESSSDGGVTSPSNDTPLFLFCCSYADLFLEWTKKKKVTTRI